MVQQPVEGPHVAVIRESQVLDASCLALFQQEVQQAVVQKSSLQRVHAATADAVQQVVVYVVHLQALKRLLVHPLRLVEVPLVLPLVRHLRGYEVFVTWETAQRVTRQHLRLAAHIHRCRVEVVHAVFDGVIHQSVHLLLLSGQAHHAEPQQRDLFTATVLYAVGHAVLTYGHWRFLVLCKHPQRPHHSHGHGGACTHTHASQEIPATHVPLVILVSHSLRLFVFGLMYICCEGCG